MTTSPTARSLLYLREHGYLAEVAEQHVPHARTTRDLFGFVDIVAVRPGETLAVQTTDSTHVANRVGKILASPKLERLRAAGWHIHVHGWRDGVLRTVDLTTG